MDSYNEFMIRHLTNYDAEVYWPGQKVIIISLLPKFSHY